MDGKRQRREAVDNREGRWGEEERSGEEKTRHILLCVYD